MNELLKIDGLHKRFGNNEVLQGIDLSVLPGHVVVLLGASGSGKSTLLRCVNFLELPTAGRLWLEGKLIGQENNGSVRYREAELVPLRRKIGMVFQQFNLFPHMTAVENVMEGPRSVLRLGLKDCRERAERYLHKVGLVDKLNSYPSHLSGGQQQRVAIARALAMEPRLMLFDEATSALDPELVGEVLQTMKTLSDEGMTMIIVTHELGFAYAVADHILYLHQGRILEQGAPDDLLLRPKEARTREFLRGHATFRLPEPEF